MSIEAVEKNVSVYVASWIQRNLPSSVRERRESALAEFKKNGLPFHRAEEYKYTPITRELETNFNFSLDNGPGKIDPASFFINDIDAHVLVFINGIFSKEYSSILPPSNEITVLPLEQAALEIPGIVNQYLGIIADDKADSLTAWNTAAWNSGVFIYVSEDKVIEKPILIYNIQDASRQVVAIQRNVLIVDRNSQVTVLEKFDSVGPSNHFTNVVTEGFVQANATLNFYSIQNDKGNHYQYNLKKIQQAYSSRVNTFTFTLDGKFLRNNLQLSLDGENIESHMYGLYLLHGSTLADNHTVVDHKRPNSFSNELYKGIIDERAKGVFNGKIFVRPQAQKTNAFQANRNILLTDKASVNTKPQLEIWADDVKCSHGCTSGQLDEEALFYLQSRGIDKEIARGIMLYAFAAEVLQSITNPILRNYLDKIISARLQKDF